jgi:hypothetical protein
MLFSPLKVPQGGLSGDDLCDVNSGDQVVSGGHSREADVNRAYCNFAPRLVVRPQSLNKRFELARESQFFSRFDHART